MKSLKLLVVMLVGSLCLTANAQTLWNADHLAQVKASIDQPFYRTAYTTLLEEAERILPMKPVSVMMKEKVAASGDKHDYLSMARYYWPDPNKPDGLPYINRDGLANPELDKLDRNRLGELATRVTTLSLAWYFSGEDRYAEKAVEMLRVWFFNKDTRMNPNLEYAQTIPGRYNGKGRCYGVLDAHSFVEMLQAIALLEHSEAFTAKDSKQLKAWFKELLHWMLTSQQGIDEGNQPNNHSIVYDVQIIAYALYTGETEVAERVIREFPTRRVFAQIQPDGRQPYELRRTLAFGYSQYNLSHMVDIFMMAQKLGIKIDDATSEDGRSFYKAMDFMMPYVGKTVEEWPYQQIVEWDYKQQEICKDFYRTAVWVNPSRKDYLRVYEQNRRIDPADRFNLIFVKPTFVDDAMAHAATQLEVAWQEVEKLRRQPEQAAKMRVSPRTIQKDGSLSLVGSHDWCCGFFPGSLWMMYDFTNNAEWRQRATSATWRIEDAKSHRGTHDLGFVIDGSFGHGYRQTGEKSYRDVVVEASRTLIKRFNKQVGLIRSWDFNREVWKFPVIIDNMMNLEMLFRASELTGDKRFREIAITHANTTLKNHFRADNSSYHVVDYDPETGEVRMKCTHQGYADESVWSRGQGWGLYGYTMCYRYTRDAAYLEQACKIADYMLSLETMPEDGIPYWDMKAPDLEKAPRDASAAAIICSALYELQGYVQGVKSVNYLKAADKILKNLYQHYRAEEGKDHGFVLLHSTGHLPGNSEIDVPLSYADYYYLEALLRRHRL